MNILLYLFVLSYDIIKSIVNLHFYIFKKIRVNYLDKYYKEHSVKDFFSLFFKIVFLSIYIFLVFHLYVFIYLIHDSSIKFGYFGIILRLISTILVSCLLGYVSKELEHIFHYLFHLFFSVLHLITWLNALLFFIFTFSKELKDIVSFKKKFDGITALLEVYLILIEKLYRLIIILAHCSNVFSIIRIIEIYKNKKDKNINSLLFKSFIYVFHDILILTPGYFFILILPPVFVYTHINICKRISNNDRDFNDEFENLCPKYNVIKSQIYKMLKVAIYIIAILLTIISFIFIWNLHKSIKILIEVFKTSNYQEFFTNYFKNIINSVIELLTFFISCILFLILVPFVWKLNKSFKIFVESYKKKEYKKFFFDYYHHLIDCLLSTVAIIFTILIHISPVHIKAFHDCYKVNKNKEKSYVLLCLNVFFEKWLDIFVFIISMFRILTINFYIYLIRKKCNIKFFFLLIDNKSIIDNNSNRNNRYKILNILFFDIITSLVMILQFILGIFNPFFTLKIIKDTYIYFKTCKNQTFIKFKEIELKYISKSIRTIIKLLYFYFIYIPISLILNAFSLWTIIYNIKLLISNNKDSLNKLKNGNIYTPEYINKEKSSINLSKYNKYLSSIFKSFIFGYISAIQLIFIHINIFRIFIFWSRYKKEDNITFENLISEQFRLSILELIYIPFLILVIILEPWNYELIQQFLEEDYCNSKFRIFKQLIVKFVNDIRIGIIFLILMVSFIDTIPTVLLIIRSIKKNYNPTEENKLAYHLNYKTEDFKTCNI